MSIDIYEQIGNFRSKLTQEEFDNLDIEEETSNVSNSDDESDFEYTWEEK